VATPTLDELRAKVAAEFSPDDVAALRTYFDTNSTDTDDAEQVAEAVAAVEHFRTTRTVPAPRTDATVVAEVTARPPVDEGADIGLDEVKAAGKRYAALDDAARSWVAVCGAKVRLSPDHGGVASLRRFEILRGLCELAEADGFDTDDIVRACAAVTSLGDDAWRRGAKVADVLAAMTLADAVLFAKVCQVVTTGDVAMAWTLEGRCVLSASVVEMVVAA
jgi:hypothetical protein